MLQNQDVNTETRSQATEVNVRDVTLPSGVVVSVLTQENGPAPGFWTPERVVAAQGAELPLSTSVEATPATPTPLAASAADEPCAQCPSDITLASGMVVSVLTQEYGPGSDFWTPERVAAALGVKMPVVTEDLGFGQISLECDVGSDLAFSLDQALSNYLEPFVEQV
jgi:hypothetical protein